MKFSFKNVKELKEKIVEIWNSIPLEKIRKLFDSMPRRSYSVLNAKGGHSKY